MFAPKILKDCSGLRPNKFLIAEPRRNFIVCDKVSLGLPYTQLRQSQPSQFDPTCSGDPSAAMELIISG